MLNENPDIALVKDKLEFDKESLRAAKGPLYPSLSLNAGMTTGKDQGDTLSGYSSQAASGASGLPGMQAASSAASGRSLQLERDSWTTDLSVNYVLFSKFNISANINSVKNGVEQSSIDLKIHHWEKKIQLYQLVMEISYLREMRSGLDRASAILSQVKQQQEHSKSLRSEQDTLHFQAKYYELVHNQAKLEGAINLAKEALKNLIPSLSESDFEKTPNIVILYPLSSLESIKQKYLKENLEIKKLDLTIDTYREYQSASSYEKPWIPSIIISSSYSRFGGFDGREQDNDYRASILFTFNLFDGNQNLARRTQAIVAHSMARKKKESETQKNLLAITKFYMDAKAGDAEYKYKLSLAKEKKHKLDQLHIVKNSGAATDLEESMLNLDYALAMYDAFNAKKNYQQALTNIAIKSNEMEKIKIEIKPL